MTDIGSLGNRYYKAIYKIVDISPIHQYRFAFLGNIISEFQRERSGPLANHKSALKRAGQNEIRRLRNRSVKSRVKTVVKEVRQAVSGDSGEAVAANLKAAQAVIDKAVKKGALHKRTGARKIARLSKLSQKAQS